MAIFTVENSFFFFFFLHFQMFPRIGFRSADQWVSLSLSPTHRYPPMVPRCLGRAYSFYSRSIGTFIASKNATWSYQAQECVMKSRVCTEVCFFPYIIPPQ